MIDGGVVNPMLVDVVCNMGAEIVIAVNVLFIAQSRKPERAAERRVEARPAAVPESTHLAVVKERANTLLRERRGEIRVFDELSRIAKAKIYAGREKLDPKTPNVFEVLNQTMHAMQYEKARLATKSADIVTYPDVSQIGSFEFSKEKEAISQGYKATKNMLPKIREVIRCP